MTELKEETRRVFFAIRLTKVITTSISARLAPIKKELKGAWTHADDLHITLKFLGDIDPQLIAPISELGLALAAQRAKFDLSLGSWGYFPRRSGPQVLWLGVNASPHLHALAAAFDTQTHKLGFASDTRPYTAHITLGRVRMRSAMLEAYLQETQHIPPQAHFLVTHIELMETTPRGTPGEARYVCLQSMPLFG